MKERLIQLLDLEQLSPSKFADLIGVQRSSVSHVISGRNKPSFDFIQKTLRTFPGLQAQWLILGEGSMYEQMGRAVSGTLFEQPEKPRETLFEQAIPDEGKEIARSEESQALEQEQKAKEKESESSENQAIDTQATDQSPGEGARVVQVMIFYDDNTFKTYQPSE